MHIQPPTEYFITDDLIAPCRGAGLLAGSSLSSTHLYVLSLRLRMVEAVLYLIMDALVVVVMVAGVYEGVLMGMEHLISTCMATVTDLRL